MLLAVLSVLAAPGARAADPDPQEAPGLVCPAVVGDQPLSVATPFSATVRGRADGAGRIVSRRLLCAYGEGATAAAVVEVSWAGGSASCSRTSVTVADELDRGPFDRLASDLGAAAGGPCAAASARRWPLAAVAAGLLLLGLLVGSRRWRGFRRAARLPAASHGAADPRPALAPLSGPGGPAFARSGAGQLAILATLAYADGDRVTGDLARAGCIAALRSAPSPRPEVPALSRHRAHHRDPVDR